MTTTFVATQWSALCQSARAKSACLTQDVSPPAAELMRAETERFCGADPPPDKEALESTYIRRMALSARLTAIGRADALAGTSPNSARAILAQVRQFCDGDLPATSDAFLAMQQRNLELTRTIARICEADQTSRIEVGA